MAYGRQLVDIRKPVTDYGILLRVSPAWKLLVPRRKAVSALLALIGGSFSASAAEMLLSMMVLALVCNGHLSR